MFKKKTVIRKLNNVHQYMKLPFIIIFVLVLSFLQNSISHYNYFWGLIFIFQLY